MNAFLSYTMRDRSIDHHTLRKIESGLRKYFPLYVDYLHNPGNNPQSHVMRALHQSRLIVLCSTPGLYFSPWVQLEIGTAHKLGIPIIVATAEELLHRGASRWYLNNLRSLYTLRQANTRTSLFLLPAGRNPSPSRMRPIDL